MYAIANVGLREIPARQCTNATEPRSHTLSKNKSQSSDLIEK